MKTPLLTVLLVLLFPLFVFAEPSIAALFTCANAEDISCGTSLNNETNADGENILETYTCAGPEFFDGYNGLEKVYRIEVNILQQYDFRLNDIQGEDLNYDLFLLEDDCGTNNCIASSTNPDEFDERISIRLNPGIYYLIVDTWAGEVGTYDLSVECGPSPGPVSCNGALELRCGQTVTDNTWGEDSNFSSDIYDCYGGTGTYRGPDIIYSFEKRRSSDHIQLILETDEPNLNIFLVTRCDGVGFSCIRTGRSFSGGKFIDEEDLGLPAGEYYVIVDGRNSATESEFSLSLYCNDLDLSGFRLMSKAVLKNQQRTFNAFVNVHNFTV